MAEDPPKHESLRAANPIPIAQLRPDIADSSNQVIEGIITITWPYSIVKKSIAFILAERDFLLRRNKGQLRIEFQGPAGKALADAHVGGGDEVRLGLDGVEWESYDQTQTRAPGEVQEWQLKFTHRLLLQIRRADSEELEVIEVEAPDTEAPTDPVVAIEVPEPDQPSALDPPEPATPRPLSPVSSRPAKRLAPSTFDNGEYASPAFLKRARVSYGSLFEDGFDAIDGSRGSSKKRSRFSLNATSWKYSSRSPSPEPERSADQEDGMDDEADKVAADQEPATITPARPIMVDEGCQTQGLEFNPLMSVQVSGEPRQSSPPLVSSPIPAFSNPVRPNAGHAMEGVAHALDHGGAIGNATTAAGNNTLEIQGNESSQLGSSFEFGSTGHLRDSFYAMPSDGFANGLLLDRLDPTSMDGLRSQNMEFISPLDHQSSAPAMNIDPSLEYHPAPTVPQNPDYPILSQDLQHQSNPFFDVSQSAAPPGQNSWTSINTSIADVPSSIGVAVQAITPSSPPQERHDSSDIDIEDGGRDAPLSEYPDKIDREDVDELRDMDSRTSESEDGVGNYRDGGEVAGEDYDLRNYDSALEDDVEEQDVESALDGGDAEEPAIEFPGRIGDIQEDDESEVLEDDVEEDAGASESGQIQESDAEAVDEEANSYAYDDSGEERVEGDYEDEEEVEEGEDEEDYDEEDEDADEYDEGAAPSRQPVPPTAPVFISLLSDSEDDEEPDQAPVPSVRQLDRAHDDAAYNKHVGMEETDDTIQVGADAAILNSGRNVLEKPVREEEEDVEMKSGNESTTKREDDEKETEESEADNDQARSPVRSQQGENDDASNSKEEVARESPQRSPSPSSQPVVGAEMASLRSPSADNAQDKASVEEPLILHEAPSDIPDEDRMQVDGPEAAEAENEESRASKVAETAQADQPAPTSRDTSSLILDSKADVTISVDSPALKDQVSSPHGSPIENLGELPPADKDGQLGTVTEGSQPLSHNSAGPSEAEAQAHGMKQAATSPANEAELVAPIVPQGAQAEDTEMEDEIASQPIEDLPLSQESHDDASVDLVDKPVEDQQLTEAEDASTTAPLPPPPVHLTEAKDASTTTLLPPPPVQEEISDNIVAAVSTLSTEAKPDADAETRETPPVEQLPTPQATQLKEGEDTMALVDEGPAQEDEESVGPDDQIMAEYLERSAAPQTTEADVSQQESSSAKKKSSTVEKDQPQEHDLRITAQSRRKHRPSDLGDVSHTDPSIALAMAAPVTPTSTRPRRGERHENKSPTTVMRVTRSKPENLDPSVSLARASNTSVRETRHMAHAAHRGKTPDLSAEVLKSPSIPDSVRSARSAVSDTDVSILKLQLMRSLRNNLPDCLAVKSLRTSLGRITDIVAVATMTPPQPHRPKHGPRDYMLEVVLTDPSVAPTGVGVAHIFRPHQASLPVIHTGDVVLLRRFSVVSMKGRGFGIRAGDASSWAVFEKGDEELLPQIKGPPLEVTREEVEYAEGLRGWWSALDEKALAKIEKATQKSSQAAKDDAK